jgi:hypothetical protein
MEASPDIEENFVCIFLCKIKSKIKQAIHANSLFIEKELTNFGLKVTPQSLGVKYYGRLYLGNNL